MIHVIATIQVKAGARERFISIFLDNVPAVMREEGCIEYAPAVDVASGIPVQNAVRDDIVVICEQWASLDNLHAHLESAHMAVYRERVKDLVISVDLQVLEPAVCG